MTLKCVGSMPQARGNRREDRRGDDGGPICMKALRTSGVTFLHLRCSGVQTPRQIAHLGIKRTGHNARWPGLPETSGQDQEVPWLFTLALRQAMICVGLGRLII